MEYFSLVKDTVREFQEMLDDQEEPSPDSESATGGKKEGEKEAGIMKKVEDFSLDDFDDMEDEEMSYTEYQRTTKTLQILV
jgi:hypothetical protein